MKNAATCACIYLDGAGFAAGRACKVILIISLEVQTLDAANNIFFLGFFTTAKKSVNEGWDS